MIPLPLIKFLKDNWLYIVIGLAVVAAVAFSIKWYNDQIEAAYNRGYAVGVADQYKKDRDKFDEMQSKHDERVKALETAAAKLADDLAVLKSDSEKKYKALNAKLDAKKKELDQVRYDAAGKPVDCPPAGADTYLGKEFSDQWNGYSTGLMH